MRYPFVLGEYIHVAIHAPVPEIQFHMAHSNQRNKPFKEGYHTSFDYIWKKKVFETKVLGALWNM